MADSDPCVALVDGSVYVRHDPHGLLDWDALEVQPWTDVDDVRLRLYPYDALHRGNDLYGLVYLPPLLGDRR